MPLQSNPFPASKQVVTDVPAIPVSIATQPVASAPVANQQPAQTQPPSQQQQPTVIVAPAPPPKTETVFINTPIQDPELLALAEAVEKLGSLGGQEAGIARKIYSFRDQLLNKAQ